MRELYRRFGALLLLFLAVTFFLAVRDDVIRLYAVDMAEEYRSAYLPVEGWGASTAMRGVVRSSKRISSVAAFIDAHTPGSNRKENFTIIGGGVSESLDQHVHIVDTPGFMPGVDQEYNGIIRHGAKVLFAYSAATVPKVTVVLRKAFGGAYIAMCARALGADKVFAWPSAEIAVMGPAGAVNIISRKEIAGSTAPEETRERLVAEYRQRFANPFVAAARGNVDAVIEPRETRRQVISALEMLKNKRDTNPPKKHGNIPL